MAKKKAVKKVVEETLPPGQITIPEHIERGPDMLPPVEENPDLAELAADADADTLADIAALDEEMAETEQAAVDDTLDALPIAKKEAAMQKVVDATTVKPAPPPPVNYLILEADTVPELAYKVQDMWEKMAPHGFAIASTQVQNQNGVMQPKIIFYQAMVKR